MSLHRYDLSSKHAIYAANIAANSEFLHAKNSTTIQQIIIQHAETLQDSAGNIQNLFPSTRHLAASFRFLIN
jgi:hypothetical protein